MKKIFIGVYLTIATISLHAQSFQQQTKLFATDRAPGNQFGLSVAVNGNFAVVGAAAVIGGDIQNAGECAYVFQNVNGSWTQTQKLFASDRASGNDFGHAVSISGNFIIIGAPGTDGSSGAVYFFERNATGSWVEVKKIVAPDKSGADMFGSAVSISGKYAVVGAPNDADYESLHSLTGAGSAYFLFRNNGNWEILNKVAVHPKDRSENAGFGFSVAISGTSAVIGAPYEKKDTTLSNPLDAAGAAYVFERNANGTMQLVHKITDWSRAMMDYFGYSVAINGNTILIGSPWEDEDLRMENPVMNAGSVHVFEKKSDNRWWWTQKIVANDRGVADNFGHSVALSGNIAIVGAVAADEAFNSLTNTGAAYIFLYDGNLQGWTTKQIKIVATDRAANDWFGLSVAIDGDAILVGAPLQDRNNTRLEASDAGAAYFFGKTGCTTSSSHLFASACKTYTSPSKKHSWTMSGSYYDTILNKAGCDSIIIIDLTITGKADTSVTVKGNTLTANAKNASYQWIDCATNQPINVTTRSLIATVKGSYKVSIDENGCTGTSSCHDVVVGKSDSTSIVTTPPVVIPRNASTQKAFLEVNKIVANDRTHNDEFGRSVSISGNYAIVGAPYDDEDEKGGSVRRAGSAYIFKLDDGGKWKQLQKISAFDRMPGAEFGCAVAISGNYLVVGANRDHLGINGLYYSNLAGSAYVYRLNNGTWQFMQKIIANPTARVQQGQAYFGTAVAIDGNTIVVAAPDHALDATDKLESSVSSAGALFVYMLTNEGWIQTQKLVSKDRQLGDGLGNSVAICGDNIIAGSWGADYDGMNANRMEAAGAAYIFERKGILWSQTQKIAAEDRSPFDEFGYSVGISGNYAVVGARRVTYNKNDDKIDDYTGNAYVFKRGGDGKWVQQMKINPDDRTKEDNLGNAVGISGDYLIVSAMKQDTDSLGNYMPDAGAIYVYYLNKNGDWIQSDKISPFYKHQLGNFGAAAAICDCNIIGTSWIDQTDENDENAISNTGAGFIFTAAGCNNNGKCNASFFPQDKIPRDFQIKDSTSNSKMPQKVQSPDLNGKGNDTPIETQVIKDESINPLKKAKSLLKKGKG
jgi:FG-GAP repeat